MSVSCRSAVLGGLVSALVATACATGGGQTEDPFSSSGSAEEDVLLTVENNDFRDATIYAYWNGVKRRVGMVVGKTSETFNMRWRSERIQLEVDFVGRGGYRSEMVDVWAGDHLNFVIMSGR